MNNFQPAPYTPQMRHCLPPGSVSNVYIVATVADFAFSAQLESAFNTAQSILANTQVAGPDGPAKTQAALIALSQLLNGTVITVASAASYGVNPDLFSGVIDYVQGLANIEAQMASVLAT
jgi:hypothetical protein